MKERLFRPGADSRPFLTELANTRVQYEKDDLPLSLVDYEYIDGFNTFLQTAHNCNNNDAVNLLCCLKNFNPLRHPQRMDRKESVPALQNEDR